MLSFCYERNQLAPDREQRIDTCMQKWRSLYAYLDSEELMDSYTQFYRQIKQS
jgi:hypothetical protein